MKKYIALISACSLSLVLMTGCGSDKTDDLDMPKDDPMVDGTNDNTNTESNNSTIYPDSDTSEYNTNSNNDLNYTNNSYVDGTYKAEAENYEGIYKHYVEITIKDHMIEKIAFDGLDETGKLRSLDSDLEHEYKTEYNVTPKDIMDMYADKLKTSQIIEDVKEVVGGEVEHEYFTKLVSSALESARTGNTETTFVDFAK